MLDYVGFVWIQGLRLRDHMRNEEIRKVATVQPVTTHLMQKRLRWYGYVRHRDESHTNRTVLDMVADGVRPRGRPKLRYTDTIKRYIKKNGLTEVTILDRKDWRMTVPRATHCQSQLFNGQLWTQHCSIMVLL